MATFTIYHDKVEQKRFENQESDLCLYKYILSHQSHSVHWAIKYEGWYVEMENEEGEFISKPDEYSFYWAKKIIK
jgi:hypothetical protein